MSRAINYLEHIYSNLNADFFNDELPIPVITVQSKPGTYGHCTRGQVWQRKDGHAYELNIAAEVLNYHIEDTIDTMLHEMVHLYCRENNIKETSRGGKYHNGRFKEEAEKRGLECYKAGQYGWNTRPGDKLIEYAMNKGWNEILLGRNSLPPAMRNGATEGAAQAGTPAPQPGKRPSSTRKYICPCCKQSIRATKDVNIICGDCMEKMVKE